MKETRSLSEFRRLSEITRLYPIYEQRVCLSLSFIPRLVSSEGSSESEPSLLDNELAHLCRMYFPILIIWTSPFPILGLLFVSYNVIPILKVHSV